MESFYGKPFPSLAHRLIYSYLIPVITTPDPECELKECEQLEFRAFIRYALEKLYQDPTIIDMPMFEDALSGQEDKDVLKERRAKVEAKLNQFFDMLIKIGAAGEPDTDGESMTINRKAVRISKHLDMLQFIGLEVRSDGTDFIITSKDFPNMFFAYNYHARKQLEASAAKRRFILGRTEAQKVTAGEYYGSFVPESGSVFFGKLEEYCSQNGYTHSNDIWGGCTVNWEREYAKKKRILFTVFIEPWRQYQVMYSIRVSDFQAVFDQFATMSDGLKQMIMDRATRCSGCRYCVQTDKTGTKPIAVSRVTFQGVDKAVCSYYPFWALHEMSAERARQLIELMGIAERVLAENMATERDNGRLKPDDSLRTIYC